MGLGAPEIGIIVVIIIILFGIKRLPKIGKDLGAGIREFRKTAKTIVEDDDEPQ